MSKSPLVAATLLLCVGVPVYGGFVAYNDVCYSSSSGHPALQPNVTTYNVGDGSPGPASGVLVDKSTGASTGVTLTLTEFGGVHWQPDPTTGGTDCAVGTDARSVFDPLSTVSLKGTVYYSSTVGWYVDATLTGLDPAATYEFVTTANRNGSYTDRFTRYTISGAESFTNASTPGTIITNNGASTAFNTGNNTETGYVARWTGIRSGADGIISVRAQADGAQNSAYSFDAIMLAESAPANAVNILPDQINTFVGGATVAGTVSIPAESNADGPVEVTLTSSDPAVADLVGSSGGVQVLTFPQNGAVEQNIEIDIGVAGSAILTSTNNAGLIDDTQQVTVEPGAVMLSPASIAAPVGAIRPVEVSISPGTNDTRVVEVTLISNNPAVADLVGATAGELVLTFPEGGPAQQTVDVQTGAVGQATIGISNSGGLTSPSLPVDVQAGAVTVTPSSVTALPGSVVPMTVSISAGSNDTRPIHVTLTSNNPVVADLIGGTSGVLLLTYEQGGPTQQTVDVRLGDLVGESTVIDITNDGGLIGASVPAMVVELRSWIIPIAELHSEGGINGPDPGRSWQMVETGGYDSGGPYTGTYPLDGRYYWRTWDLDLVWQQVYWRFDAPDVPSQPRLYTIECWVPYLGEDDPRSWKQIDVKLNGTVGEGTNYNDLMIPRNSHNQWIKKGQLGSNETEGGWKPAGPGPNAPDSPACDAGSGGSYFWLKRGSMLYMDGSTSVKYGVSALRITEVFSAVPVCEPPVSDGPVDLRCLGNADPLYTLGEGFGTGQEANIDGNTLAVEGYRWPCNEGSTQVLPLSPGLPYDGTHPDYAMYTAQLPTGPVTFRLRYDGWNTLKWRNDTDGTFSKYNVFTLNGVPDRDFVPGHFGRLYVLATKGGGSSGRLRVETIYSSGPSEVTEANLYDWFNQDGDTGSLAVGTDGRLRSEGEDVIGFERLNNWGLAPNPTANPPWQVGNNGGDHGGAFLFVHPVEVDRSRTLTQVMIGLGDVENFGGELVVLGVSLEVGCGTPFADADGDGDVDQDDFAILQTCLTGMEPTILSGQCACFERAGSADTINDIDVAEFEKCATGPDVPFDLDSPPADCVP